jgi:dihydroflavonol-4-reductase
MKSRSVSITGASGFVGWHIAEACVREGWNVRSLVRRRNRKPVPQGSTAVECELTSESLAAACVGTDVLVHCAALIRAPDERTFDAVNVGGAVAAATAAVLVDARLVLISSQAAGGPGTRDAPRAESDPPAPVNAYGRSKLASEGVVRSTTGLRWIILRPCAVYGPRDRGFLPLFRMARAGLFVLPAPASTAFTLIYVADLVQAVLLAAGSTSADGQTLFLGHSRPSTSIDVLGAIAQAERRRFVPRRVPWVLSSALAAAGDLAWKFGMTPVIDSGRLAELRAPGFVCTVDRARDVLGFSAGTPLDAGIEQTARWYKDAGW